MNKIHWIILISIIVIGMFMFSKNVLLSPVQKQIRTNVKSPLTNLPESCLASKDQAQQFLNTINSQKNKAHE